jgi:hypothetical protein
METTLRKYEICPDCGRMYWEHLQHDPYQELPGKFKEYINAFKGLPVDAFRTWLIDRRSAVTQKIANRHFYIESNEKDLNGRDLHTVNLLELIELQKWYEFVDILDSEIVAAGKLKRTISKGGLTNPEKALVAVYKNEMVGRDQGALYNKFTKYCRITSRVAPDCGDNRRSIQTHFKRLNNVINALKNDPKAKELAETDRKTFMNRYGFDLFE